MEVNMVVGAVVNAVGIIVNIAICYYTLNANRRINKENAGKNRIIYEIEIVKVQEGSEASKNRINQLLSSSKYTVLNAFQDIGSFSQTVYTLGKIAH